mmetsp:Transcript_35454/g.82720  ORF Transcript_35454/g.82720 Transcript_35454/m.82720 type:complete len:659 (-) Transcript_35454:90-2066(-)
MHPEARRRLRAKLDENAYSCSTFCQELPYTIWNTCPLCMCGLMPVFVVCFSAICRLDYATHVTDIGAEIINEMGLSYTVYYTAGCWPPAVSYAVGQEPKTECNTEDFEIAAAEYDALTGSLLRVRNVTAIQARRLTGVKVTPDWRFVLFVGSLSNGVGNIYSVDAQETDARRAVPLLTQVQMDALDAACQLHTRAVLDILEERGHQPVQKTARITGFKHLQVIIPGIEPVDFGGTFQGLPAQPPGTSLVYRAAFSFVCRQVETLMSGKETIEFSKVAVLDFSLKGLTGHSVHDAYASSELRVLDTETQAPAGSSPFAHDSAKRFQSQSCPRFVPSKQGAELLFVAEDIAPAGESAAPRWSDRPMSLPSRVLAQMQMLPQVPTGRKLRSTEDAEAHSVPEREDPGPEPDYQKTPRSSTEEEVRLALERHEAKVLMQGAKEVPSVSKMLDMGRHEMPFAPVSGCPEFVPSLYSSTKTLAEAFRQDLFASPEERQQQQLREEQTRDSFVVLTDPSSNSVLGVDAQVLAGSLSVGPPMGEVAFMKLLYNVKSTIGTSGQQQLLLGGCKPIRAAGRDGHMKMEAALESVMKTLQIHDEKQQYTTWLACLTADQRVSIVESLEDKHWINMSMPYPFWTGKSTQHAWCHHQESCFEVWSNPNPNE